MVYRYPSVRECLIRAVYRYPIRGTGTPCTGGVFGAWLGLFERGFLVLSLMGYFEPSYNVLLLYIAGFLLPFARVIKKGTESKKGKERRRRRRRGSEASVVLGL